MADLHIGVVGNIGAGKSTLVEKMKSPRFKELLFQRLSHLISNREILTFSEEFDESILEKFYLDPKRYALMAQLEFFNGRFTRQERIAVNGGIAVEDRTLKEDYHVFGKAQKIQENMTLEEFKAYEKMFKLFTQKMSGPDVIIYLRADVGTILKRIAKRGRDAEKEISIEYLSLLAYLYESFIANHCSCPVIIIDANQEAETEEYFELIMNQLIQKVLSLRESEQYLNKNL